MSVVSVYMPASSFCYAEGERQSITPFHFKSKVEGGLRRMSFFLALPFSLFVSYSVVSYIPPHRVATTQGSHDTG